MKRIVLSVAVIFAIVAVSGCRKASETLAEKIAEKAIEKQSGGQADVNFDGEKITVKTKDGEMVAMTGGSAAVPADFPKDVFVVKGAIILASFNVPEGCSLTMESKEGADSVIKSYESEMKKQGWAEEARVNTGEATMLSYRKDNNKRSANVMVGKSGNGCQVVLTTSSEKSVPDTSDAGAEATAQE